jgi:hypothetical protein
VLHSIKPPLRYCSTHSLLAYWRGLLGDNVAASFKREYEAYREVGMVPDLIFGKLQEFAGGSQRGTPRYEAAVLAVLAFLFEQCDIFESPPEVAAG